MTNTYQLIQDDAFSWLERRAANSIHAVVTDPPYAVIEYSAEHLSKRKNGKGGIWRLPQNFDGVKRSPTPRFTVLTPSHHQKITEFHSRLAPLLFKVLTPGGHAIVASQNLLSHLVVVAFTRVGFEMRGQIARVVRTLRGGDRPKGAHRKYAGLSVSPRSCWEPWLIFRKPCEGTVRANLRKWQTGALRRPATESPFTDLIVSGPARGTERELAPHPSLKPQAFMRQIVWAALPLGEGVILDPFMGSGSTVAAARSLGLESIGIELRHEYYKLAQKAVRKLGTVKANSQDESAADAKGQTPQTMRKANQRTRHPS